MGTWTGALALAAMALATSCRPRPPETALEQAAAGDDAAGIRQLVAQGADPNAFDSQGGTALMSASRGGHAAAVEALVTSGARTDLVDHRTTGWTALMHAVHKRQHQAARVLLDHGADPNARTRGGVTALIMASAYGDTEMVRLLLDRAPELRRGPGLDRLGSWLARGRGCDEVRALLGARPS